MSRAVKKHYRAVTASVLALTVALAVAACGGGASSTVATSSSGKLSEMTEATLVLDFIPNAVHAGIYRAVEAGYYEEENIKLNIIQPTSTADTLKLIDAGKAQFGIADGIDVATQLVEGRSVEGIMALLERPPGGLIALKKEGITNPKQFEGKTVGITGVPSDTAILNTVISTAGGNPKNVHVVTIGFNGVQNTENGKVSGFIGFIPADGVQMEHDGFPIKAFAADEWGAPSYPGLVVFSTPQRVKEEPALMQAFVSATIKGYEDVFKNPQLGIEALVKQNKGIDEGLAKASLTAYMPLFKGKASQYGTFEPKVIEELSEYMIKNELSKKPFKPSEYATNKFVEGAG
ncbi:MAG: ABC transporter substrate-binding protein [Actinobacteria bacterium]|nr:ABC transporter substrate-binding protein [Actinomycetota bacterium]